MAENKKSFVLYADLIHTVKQLPDDKAGALFKHILAYVNDQNPTTDDLIVNIAFEPIKQQLKRDLIKWEDERADRSESGRLGGIKSGEIRRKKKEANEAPLQKGSTASKNEANEAVNANVTVTVNDNVSVNESQYKAPAIFLIQSIEISLELLHKKSRLPEEQFKKALTQWSLKCEEDGWEYSGDAERDLKRLRAGFEKWLNTWTDRYEKNEAQFKVKAPKSKIENTLTAVEEARRIIRERENKANE